MAKCDYCGTRIFLGGERDGTRRFCNQKCLQNGILLNLTSQVPREYLQQQVEEVHAGPCPNCHGPGPVDAHTSYRVWSMLILTTWSSRPHVCCRSCGIKKQLGDTFISLFFGWWGFPWGLLMTPLQIGRNIVSLVSPPSPPRPPPYSTGWSASISPRICGSKQPPRVRLLIFLPDAGFHLGFAVARRVVRVLAVRGALFDGGALATTAGGRLLSVIG